MENHPKIFCQDIFRAMCTFSYNDRPVIVHLSDCPPNTELKLTFLVSGTIINTTNRN